MDGSPLSARIGLRSLLALACLACLCGLALLGSVRPAAGLADSTDTQAVPGQLIVGFRPTATDAMQQKAVDRADATIEDPIDSIDAAMVSVDPNETDAATQELLRQRAVQYVEPNFVLHASRLPNDRLFGEHYGGAATMASWRGETSATVAAAAAWRPLSLMSLHEAHKTSAAERSPRTAGLGGPYLAR